MEDDDAPDRGGRALLGAFNVFLVVAAFFFGFLSGVISDGTVEVLNDFRRRQPERSTTPRTAVRSPDSGDGGVTASTVQDAVNEAARTMPRKASGTIDWSISVPAGTQLADVLVTSELKDEPIRLRLATLKKGRPATPAATLWLDPGSSATISLPAGWYRAGSTRLREGVVWDERAGDETYLDRAMRIDPIEPGERQPTMTIAQDGSISVRNAATAGRSSTRPRSRPAKRVRDEDYFGLGREEAGGGVPTYG